jgi:hypothetical protein
MKCQLLGTRVAVGLFAAAVCLLPVSGGFAQDSGLSEQDQAQDIIEKHPFQLERDKDPFKPLVRPPPPKVFIPPPRPNREKDVKLTEKQLQPVVAPLKMQVLGIVGNDGERLAMIRFNNGIKILRENDEVAGEFKVIAIKPDQITVFSIRENCRRPFPLSYGQ